MSPSGSGRVNVSIGSLVTLQRDFSFRTGSSLVISSSLAVLNLIGWMSDLRSGLPDLGASGTTGGDPAFSGINGGGWDFMTTTGCWSVIWFIPLTMDRGRGLGGIPGLEQTVDGEDGGGDIKL